jgi:hypothetical protein
MNTLVTILIIVAVLVIPVILVIGLYNGLVQLRNRYKNAFAQIDVQLKRRYDLIPNLVETVKSYMHHELETLEAVIQARNAATSAREQASPADGGQYAGELQSPITCAASERTAAPTSSMPQKKKLPPRWASLAHCWTSSWPLPSAPCVKAHR